MTLKYALDDIDLEIVRLLVQDARRPYSEIAEYVGLSGPAVSDRVDRLTERNIIQQFTVKLDRQLFVDGIPVVITIQVLPSEIEHVYRTVAELDETDHVFKTHDGTVVAYGTAPEQNLSAWIRSKIDMRAITEFDIKLVEDYSWEPEIRECDLALSCVECGNRVTNDGVIAQTDDETLPFCCPLCEDAYEHEQREC